ncbi:NAD(P)/FAD-dependent oxidoreductase [uncultured Devosia sp.]|uniref:NAD(P)/FAD-dependent oxidoreductase n=1 Tax=uncultured Devosia sp. TaxID=211434 RepID=UPI0035CAF7BA
MATGRHRVVIVGGGFGGLAAAQALKGAAVDITLIDRRNHHLFQPLLYQVATAALGTSEIAWPIRHILKHRPEVRTILASVTGVDKVAKTVQVDDGSSLPYDSLIIATGARHAYFGHDEWEPFAPGLKTLEDATTIRRKLLLAFEAAERESDPQLRKALLTFVIIGGGPTGVEMAGAIVELAHTSLRDEFRSLATDEARVVLIESGTAVLGNFAADLSAYAHKALTTLGVDVELGHAATAIDADGVDYGGRRVASKTIIWAAGVQASPAAKWLGLEADRAGRVKVEPDLTVPSHQEIFVIGDTASLAMPDGKPIPGVGDAAKQGGKHAAATIKARLAGDTSPHPFRYRHAGDLATIGKRAAVIDFGWIKLTGRIAWWVWGLAHIYFLIDAKNRIAVALSWLWIYLSGQRSARLITQGDVEEQSTSGKSAAHMHER